MTITYWHNDTTVLEFYLSRDKFMLVSGNLSGIKIDRIRKALMDYALGTKR